MKYLLLAFMFAQSVTATCPYDGDGASLERMVGSGEQRVCWYGHQHLEHDSEGRPKFVHHSFYQSCPN